MRRIVVAGASRGIGAALAAHFVERGDEVVSLSRTRAISGRWLACDLSEPDGIDRAVAQIDAPLDALIYAAGIWEAGAFTDAYDFRKSSPDEIRKVIDVNLIGPILLSQKLLPALMAADSGRIALIGSVSGLENTADPEVAYTASKFGLRGAAQALHAGFFQAGIAVSVINPGNVATDEVLEDIASGAFGPQSAIPLSDIVAATEFLLGLSRESVATEINLYQMRAGAAPGA